MDKLDKPKKAKRIYCTWCETEIEGEGIKIETKRGSKMHICKKCWEEKKRTMGV